MLRKNQRITNGRTEFSVYDYRTATLSKLSTVAKQLILIYKAFLRSSNGGGKKQMMVVASLDPKVNNVFQIVFQYSI